MPLAVNDKLQIRLYSTRGDQTAINVLNYRVDATSGLTDEQTVIERYATLVAPMLKGVMSNFAQFYGADLRTRVLSTYGPAYNTNFGAGTGLISSDCLPRQVCGLIRYKTGPSLGTPPHFVSGRTYTPFPPETENVATGIPSAAFVINLTALGNTFGPTVHLADGANTIDLHLQILERVSGASGNVVLIQGSNRWATQKRRGDFGKVNAPSF